MRFVHLSHFENQWKILFVKADASELLEAVSEASEPWSFDDLPSNGEGKMPTYLVRDTKMIKGDRDTLLREDPLTVPIVIGKKCIEY